MRRRRGSSRFSSARTTTIVGTLQSLEEFLLRHPGRLAAAAQHLREAARAERRAARRQGGGEVRANGNRGTSIPRARSSRCSGRPARRAWTCSRSFGSTICRWNFPSAVEREAERISETDRPARRSRGARICAAKFRHHHRPRRREGLRRRDRRRAHGERLAARRPHRRRLALRPPRQRARQARRASAATPPTSPTASSRCSPSG